MCCSAFFAVRWCDGALMAEGILSGSTDEKNGIIDRCRSIVQNLGDGCGVTGRFRIESIGWNRFERFIAGTSLRCPVLTDDGACGIHAFRPRICRLAGTIFRDPGSGIELDDFCEIAMEARRNPRFTPPEFPLDESLLRAIEFDDAMRRKAGEEIPAGFTIPAAGILEYLDTISERR